MRLGKDIIGKWIVTTNEGRQMGKVKDLLLDPSLSQLNGIFVAREGMFRRKTVYIPREYVVVYGVDAVLIESESSVVDSRSHPIDGWVRLTEIIGRPIDTPGGTKLATLGDMILNAEGQITGFSLAKVSVTGPIADNRAIARPAIIDTGNEDGTMTIDLSMAESLGMPTETTTFMHAIDRDEEVAVETESVLEDAVEEKSPASELDLAEELSPAEELAEIEAEVADGLIEPPESLESAE